MGNTPVLKPEEVIKILKDSGFILSQGLPLKISVLAYFQMVLALF